MKHPSRSFLPSMLIAVASCVGLAFLFAQTTASQTRETEIAYAPPESYSFINQWSVNDAYGVAVDASGNVFVTSSTDKQVYKFDANGNAIGMLNPGTRPFQLPFGIAIDQNGFIYVADNGRNEIRKFDPNTLQDVKRWKKGCAAYPLLKQPRGIGTSGANRVYVADSANHVIQIYDANGMSKGCYGGLGKGEGKFTWPSGVAVDAAGKIWVSESNIHRVQVLKKNGTHDKFCKTFDSKKLRLIPKLCAIA